ncbi:thioesterase family protein [Pusillimonas sp. ANT_WB101]|uniref:thioesterase family protein n=1 Tax=Pusillimonas sp. ANT_WB101 TaxID=2597356 RepID=UPI0011F095EF|nr:thioesterase family protein [Pusillimonas sp. ANT_WB101]KAA0892940.1 thioesterase [Pusillimonas sp. ANT_WB101]
MPETTNLSTATAQLNTTLTVSPEWIDLYGHMNASEYVGVFDHTGYKLLGQLGVGESYTAATNCGIYTVDIAVNYRRELLVNAPLELRLRVLAADHKRLLCLMELYQTDDGYLAATMEQLSVHVDLGTRRATAFPADITEQLQAVAIAHAAIPMPERHISRLSLLRPKKPV